MLLEDISQVGVIINLDKSPCAVNAPQGAGHITMAHLSKYDSNLAFSSCCRISWHNWTEHYYLGRMQYVNDQSTHQVNSQQTVSSAKKPVKLTNKQTSKVTTKELLTVNFSNQKQATTNDFIYLASC